MGSDTYVTYIELFMGSNTYVTYIELYICTLCAYFCLQCTHIEL